MTTDSRQLFVKWALFLTLSIIWGSSFILMKEGMKALSAYEVASLRMLSAGIVLLPVAFRHAPRIPRSKISFMVLSGLLGSFIPAYLFCLAELRISSSLAGFLNALTPIFTIILGAAFFGNHFARSKIIGVGIAFSGMLLLFLGSSERGETSYWGFASLVLLATLSYAANVNLVARYLKDIRSLPITAIACAALILPAIVVLTMAGFFSRPFNDSGVWLSLGASSLLGIMGTAVATILFYVLLKRAGPLFSSTVTYGIPFVALFWGWLAGETIGPLQVAGLGIILVGVYRSSK